VGLSGFLLFLFLAVVCTGAIYWASRIFFDRGGPGDEGGAARPTAARPAEPRRPGSGSSPSVSPEKPSSHQVYEDFTHAPEIATPAPPPEIAPGAGARVAVVIDDLGRSVADLDTLDALGVPLTYAVLPFESHTPEVAAELARRDREVLVHLPMEPVNGANPGPGALTRAMGRRELVRATRAALAAVPGAVGVNNHMGSGLCTDRRAMRTVLGVLEKRGLYFLDSRTTADTVAYQVATSLGIPAAERQVFLDREPTPEEITHQFRRLLALARERGSATAIGHPHPETLEVLAREIPGAVERGYDFVPVSFLLQRPGELPE
jgi:polysaccharide deacetylase 2 family uncharacterized protein YibQ